MSMFNSVFAVLYKGILGNISVSISVLCIMIGLFIDIDKELKEDKKPKIKPMKTYNVVHKTDKTYSQKMDATSLKGLQSCLKEGYIAQEIK